MSVAEEEPQSRRSFLPPPEPKAGEQMQARALGFISHLGRLSQMTAGTLRASVRRPL